MHKGKGCTCVCAHHNRCPLGRRRGAAGVERREPTRDTRGYQIIDLLRTEFADAQLSFRNGAVCYWRTCL